MGLGGGRVAAEAGGTSGSRVVGGMVRVGENTPSPSHQGWDRWTDTGFSGHLIWNLTQDPLFCPQLALRIPVFSFRGTSMSRRLMHRPFE